MEPIARHDESSIAEPVHAEPVAGNGITDRLLDIVHNFEDPLPKRIVAASILVAAAVITVPMAVKGHVERIIRH